MENNIDNKLKELDDKFSQKYLDVCALNDERIEKEYTLKQRLNDMADILEQKYENIRSYVHRCIRDYNFTKNVDMSKFKGNRRKLRQQPRNV